MKIPSVQKIRKLLLVMGVVIVALASLLFGDTTHQAHAATKDTQPLNAAISAIDLQRTQTAQSLLTLNSLSNNDYYTQAASDYDTVIEPQVNLWLSSLAKEEQQNIPLNSEPQVQSTIKNAMQESYRLNNWTNYVATSISSGSGVVPLEDFSFNSDTLKVILKGVFDVSYKIVSDYNSNCQQKIRDIEAWYPSWITLHNVITGQPLPRPQPECSLVP